VKLETIKSRTIFVSIIAEILAFVLFVVLGGPNGIWFFLYLNSIVGGAILVSAIGIWIINGK
jgi:hypothetical protein